MGMQFRRQILRHPPRHPQRQALVVGLTWGLFLVVAIGFLLWYLTGVWQLGANDYAWVDYYFFLGLVTLVTLPLFRVIRRGTDEYWQADASNTALLVEPMSIPLADPQPLSLPEDETLAKPEWFGWVGVARRKEARRNGWMVRSFPPTFFPVLGLSALVLGPLSFVVSMPMLRNVLLGSSLIGLYQIFLCIFIGCLFIGIFGFFTDGGPVRQRLYATQNGLRWGKRLIPWRAITGFYCYLAWNHVTKSMEPVTYRVDGDGVILYWYLPRHARAEGYAISDLFASFVTAYSLLPLRDVTPYVAELQANGNDFKRYIAARKAAGVDTTELAAVLDPPRPLLTPRQRRARLGWSIITAVPLALLIIVPIGLQSSAQPRYFAGLSARITARTPLFTDSLAQPDGRWPITARTYFKNGAYRLNTETGSNAPSHSTDGPVMALLPARFGNVAVQVTITGRSFQGGIAVRVDEKANKFLALEIDQAGNVSFQRCPITTSGSDSICQQLDLPFNPTYKQANMNGDVVVTPHTLLLVSRSNTWVYYVDGRLAGSYRDDLGISSQVGRVGIYGDVAGDTTAFTDFAIYPIDATLPWGY